MDTHTSRHQTATGLGLYSVEAPARRAVDCEGEFRTASRAEAVIAWFRNPLGNLLLFLNLLLVGRQFAAQAARESLARLDDCYCLQHPWPALELANALIGGLYAVVSAPSWMVVNFLCGLVMPILDLLDYSTRMAIGQSLFVVVGSLQWLAVGNGWPAIRSRCIATYGWVTPPAQSSIVPPRRIPELDAGVVTPLGSSLEDVLQDSDRVAVRLDGGFQPSSVATTHR